MERLSHVTKLLGCCVNLCSGMTSEMMRRSSAILREPVRTRDSQLQIKSEDLTCTPIFIIGMPRSGTTLLEQMLSCRSDIYAGGELSLMRTLAGPLSKDSRLVTACSLEDVRRKYLSSINRLAKAEPYLTDKMPQNFLYLPVILSALPEAKIVHIRRDPAATCWSNFKQYFGVGGMAYSYSMDDTIAYFHLYEDLMSFWEMLYPDRIIHQGYEELTKDFESNSRVLTEKLGLYWDSAILRPHENPRAVRTAPQN